MDAARDRIDVRPVARAVKMEELRARAAGGGRIFGGTERRGARARRSIAIDRSARGAGAAGVRRTRTLCSVAECSWEAGWAPRRCLLASPRDVTVLRTFAFFFSFWFFSFL